MPAKSPIINVMEGAVRKAARSLVRDFGEVEQLQVSRRGPLEFVSAAGQRAERALYGALHKGRPDFGLSAAESPRPPPAAARTDADAEAGADTDANADRDDPAPERWIVAPLAGRTNFLHGVPHFALSVAHEAHGRIVAGLVYQPLTDELFWAVRGGGAFLNRRRLRVSSRNAMADALLATARRFRGKPEQPACGAPEAVLPGVAGVRRFGAVALDLAWVAAGRCDAFWAFDLAPRDVAAGLLLVREAGGAVSDLAGRDRAWGGGEVLASNSALHGDLRRLAGDAVRSAAAAGRQAGEDRPGRRDAGASGAIVRQRGGR